MCTLDLSKFYMFSFYYDVFRKKYSDTDSFVLDSKTEDIYEDFQEISQHMDFSGYDKNHKCYDPKIKRS